MTISTSYSPLSYAGNGSSTTFAVTWQFFEDDEIVVTLISAGGVETVQTLTTHYTVTGGAGDNDGAPSTGTVNMVTAPASGVTLRITRNTAKVQATDLTNTGRFAANAVEWMCDRLMLIAQEMVAGTAADGITGDVLQLNSAGAVDYWDGESQILRYLANGTENTDAATLGQVTALIAAAASTTYGVPQNVTASAEIATGQHFIASNSGAITITLASGLTWCWVSRSSQSAANVTVVSADAPSVTVEDDTAGVIVNQKVGPVLFITDPTDASNYVTVTPQLEAFGSAPGFDSKTVAELASLTPSAGVTYYASDGRKNGEGAGFGTGVLVFGDGSNWIAADTGATVAA